VQPAGPNPSPPEQHSGSLLLGLDFHHSRTLGTIPANVPGLPAPITRLHPLFLIPRLPDPGVRAIPADVPKLPTTVTLDRVGLAIAGKVIVPATLVANDPSRTAAESPATSTTSTAEITTADTAAAAAANPVARALWTVTCQVAGTTTGVTSGARAAGTGVASTAADATATADTKVRAVGLEMTDTAAGVTLLGVVGAGLGAGRGLVAGLLAVVAETLGLWATVGKVTNVTALETTFSSKGHGFRQFFL